MVDGGLSSEAGALELRFAAVVDAERARLGVFGQHRQQIGELSVPVLRHLDHLCHADVLLRLANS
jgi:hypothetical protein